MGQRTELGGRSGYYKCGEYKWVIHLFNFIKEQKKSWYPEGYSVKVKSILLLLLIVVFLFLLCMETIYLSTLVFSIPLFHRSKMHVHIKHPRGRNSKPPFGSSTGVQHRGRSPSPRSTKSIRKRGIGWCEAGLAREYIGFRGYRRFLWVQRVGRVALS